MHLSQISVEEEMSNDGGQSLWWLQTDFDGGHLGKVTGAKMEVMVDAMVVGVVKRVVWSSLGLLLEWVIYIGVADDLGMTVGNDSDGNKGSAVMSGGGGGFVNSTWVGG